MQVFCRVGGWPCFPITPTAPASSSHMTMDDPRVTLHLALANGTPASQHVFLQAVAGYPSSLACTMISP